MMFVGFSECEILESFRYAYFDDLVSTNDECLSRASLGDPGGLWVISSRQTAGRGRRGKVWSSDKGNLYASLLLVDNLPKNSLVVLSFAISIAVHSVIASILPVGTDIKIKWPNDILVFKRKIAGILIETLKLKSGLQAIVIGIGVNVEHCPQNNPYPTTCLQKEGIYVDLQDVFPLLYQEVAKILALWKKDVGQEEIMRIWRCFAYGIGNSITINLPNRSIMGRFVGIDDFGCLLLEESKGCFHRVFTGDIFE